jgi:hypothetical protein
MRTFAVVEHCNGCRESRRSNDPCFNSPAWLRQACDTQTDVARGAFLRRCRVRVCWAWQRWRCSFAAARRCVGRRAGSGQVPAPHTPVIAPSDVALHSGYRIETVASGLRFWTGVAFGESCDPRSSSPAFRTAMSSPPRLLRVDPVDGNPHRRGAATQYRRRACNARRAQRLRCVQQSGWPLCSSGGTSYAGRSSCNFSIL